MAAHRERAKAIHSGTAVKASEKLWIVSAKSATEPENATITIWKSAVIISATSEILSALIPTSLDSSESSTESELSCEWEKGIRCDRPWRILDHRLSLSWGCSGPCPRCWGTVGVLMSVFLDVAVGRMFLTAFHPAPFSMVATVGSFDPLPTRPVRPTGGLTHSRRACSA